jgi:hypothetical protein
MHLLKQAIPSYSNGFTSSLRQNPDAAPRPSVDPTRHGRLLECVVLKSEPQEAFTRVFEHYLQKIKPIDGVEYGIVEDMAAATWRLHRRCASELHSLASNATLRSPDDEMQKVINRYQTRLRREHQYSLDMLKLLREIDSRGGSIEIPPLPMAPALSPAQNRNYQTNLEALPE